MKIFISYRHNLLEIDRTKVFGGKTRVDMIKKLLKGISEEGRCGCACSVLCARGVKERSGD